MAEKYIEIKLDRCVLYLTPLEIRQLLKLDLNLWRAGLERGKALTRSRTNKLRQDKHISQRYLKDPGATGDYYK